MREVGAVGAVAGGHRARQDGDGGCIRCSNLRGGRIRRGGLGSIRGKGVANGRETVVVVRGEEAFVPRPLHLLLHVTTRGRPWSLDNSSLGNLGRGLDIVVALAFRALGHFGCLRGSIALAAVFAATFAIAFAAAFAAFRLRTFNALSATSFIAFRNLPSRPCPQKTIHS